MRYYPAQQRHARPNTIGFSSGGEKKERDRIPGGMDRRRRCHASTYESSAAWPCIAGGGRGQGAIG